MPEVRKLIPIMRPWMGKEEAEAASRPILNGWVTQGPEVEAFEREFSAYTGAPHACAVSNCSTALHLALRAVGSGPGDEVITVSHSFIATANSIRYTGAIPVFVDIDPESFNLDPALVERAITSRTRAILCVHQMGMPCEVERLLAIARRHGLPVVEDAACAIGSEILVDGRWEKIGKPHGDVACFSFHPRKLLTTGDGGMLTTANPAFDRSFRLWRQHSMSMPDTVRHASRQVLFESYTELGYNYRMTDIQAAVGREQLKRLEQLVRRRRELAARYVEELSGVPGLGLPKEQSWARSNWQSYCIRLPENRDQSAFMQAMLDAGVATRRGIMCTHREPAYASEPWTCGVDRGVCGCARNECARLRQSELCQDHCVLLPLFHQITNEEHAHVCQTIRGILGT